MQSRKLEIIFLLVGMFIFSGCQKQEQEKQETSPTIPVRAVEVMVRDLKKTLEYVGTIKARDEAVVYPKVSGKIIEKLKDEGSAVAKGEAIAYIDRDEVGMTFQNAPVESPLAGVIGKVYVDIGAHVLSTTPIALVVNMDQVKIILDIPELYLPKVFLGQDALVSVDAYPEEKFSGKITKVSPIVNTENRAAPVEITIDNTEHRLKSGMFANVALVIETHPQVPVILKEAILGKGENTYVYVVQDKKATRRQVRVGVHEGPLYEIADGLKEGELAVVMGQQRLYDQAPVTVEIGNGSGKEAGR